MSDTQYQIMIVEDEELMADTLEMQLEQMGHGHFGTVDNSKDAFELLQEKQPDLILMDVNIQGEYDGIELVDMIQEQWDIPVLFISSLHDDQTFRRISRTQPLGFLVKPFTEIQLKRSIGLAMQQLEQAREPEFELSKEAEKQPVSDFLFVKSRKKLHKIRIEDIFYLEADGRYCVIQMVDRKYLVRMSLREMAERLHSQRFIQTHRSYFVNIDKIKTLDLEDNVVVLENMHIPISRREKDAVLERLDWI